MANPITLTQLVKTDEIKQLTNDIQKPNPNVAEPKAKPPRQYENQEYALIGTAIDYLIRIEIQKQSPDKIYKEDYLALKVPQITNDMKIINTLGDALNTIQDYHNNTTSTTPIQASLDLARIETIYRRGKQQVHHIKPHLNKTDESFTTDLQNLLQLTPDHILNPTNYAILNPRLNLPAQQIRADADLIIDGTLIDIKTTINPKLTTNYWRQLIGYLTLIDIHIDNDWQINGRTPERPEHVGIYFARSGELHTYPTDRIYDHENYQEIKDHIKTYNQ